MKEKRTGESSLRGDGRRRGGGEEGGEDEGLDLEEERGASGSSKPLFIQIVDLVYVRTAVPSIRKGERPERLEIHRSKT